MTKQDMQKLKAELEAYVYFLSPAPPFHTGFIYFTIFTFFLPLSNERTLSLYAHAVSPSTIRPTCIFSHSACIPTRFLPLILIHVTSIFHGLPFLGNTLLTSRRQLPCTRFLSSVSPVTPSSVMTMVSASSWNTRIVSTFAPRTPKRRPPAS